MSGSTVRDGSIRVWDPVVRLFHWGTVALCATAYLSPGERWLHEPAGYAVLVLVLVRVIWGFVGSRSARFADFVASPASVLAYLRQLRRGRAPRYLGHNPAGGAMIVVLLTTLMVVCGSGWMSETDRWFGVAWVEQLHSISTSLLLLLIALHVAGVVASSVLHKENLIRAMITGRKPAEHGAVDAPEWHRRAD